MNEPFKLRKLHGFVESQGVFRTIGSVQEWFSRQEFCRLPRMQHAGSNLAVGVNFLLGGGGSLYWVEAMIQRNFTEKLTLLSTCFPLIGGCLLCLLGCGYTETNSDPKLTKALNGALGSESPTSSPSVSRSVKSLDGRELSPPEMAPERFAKLDADLALAKENWNANPDDPHQLIWVARRLGYLWRYHEAIELLTQGIERHPEVPHLYRHRGHRYITIREFDKAIVDLVKAARLI